MFGSKFPLTVISPSFTGKFSVFVTTCPFEFVLVISTFTFCPLYPSIFIVPFEVIGTKLGILVLSGTILPPLTVAGIFIGSYPSTWTWTVILLPSGSVVWTGKLPLSFVVPVVGSLFPIDHWTFLFLIPVGISPFLTVGFATTGVFGVNVIFPPSTIPVFAIGSQLFGVNVIVTFVPFGSATFIVPTPFLFVVTVPSTGFIDLPLSVPVIL